MMRARWPARGLYAITDSALHAGADLERAVAGAIAGGARAIQYRDKSADAERRHAEASMLVRVCRRYAVPIIVNDDVELALEVGADGVHLGRDDEALAAARSRLGPDFVIGVSCYDQVALAETAEAGGADYVAFGSMFPSATKPDATPAGIAVIEQARPRVRVPIVAIGGITPQNSESLLDAGVDMLAVVSGVFARGDPAEAASEYSRLFRPQTQDEEA